MVADRSAAGTLLMTWILARHNQPKLEQAPSEQSQKIERMSTSGKEEDRPTQKSLFESKSEAADDSLSLPVGLLVHVTAKADAATGGADTKQSSSSRPKTKTTVTDAGTRTSSTNTTIAESDTSNDPTKIWAAWSARKQHDCLDGNGNAKKGCNCFEGLGSVM